MPQPVNYADESDYEIYEPHLLYVTHLREGALISVVRSLEVETDSEMYKPVLCLTKGLEIFHHVIGEHDGMDGGRCEVTIFKT